MERLGFVICGAVFGLGGRLVECYRPENHPYPHRIFATDQDLERVPYPEPYPDRELYDMDAERRDRQHDEGVWLS